MKMSKLFLIAVFLCTPLFANAEPESLPIRGIHFSAPRSRDLPLCLKFIREALPKEGVNTLFLEFNYNFQYKEHLELADRGALSEAEVKEILAACREANVELIPQINCLGHQSWAEHTGKLLTVYPEFDETPGKYPNNEDIYCRSYCPLHPEVHKVIFSLIDELADACEAKAFHVGMDEVFIIADEDCPRCQGKDPAKLFAYEVRLLHEHLAESNRTLWMWGDRFINGEVTGIGKWEASANHTEDAIDMVPKDIMICDWHYERAEPTLPYFALKGFSAVYCPWRKSEAALEQLKLVRSVRKNAHPETAQRAQGMLQTTWCGMAPFVRAYYGEGNPNNKAANESVDCFKTLFAEIRHMNQ